MSKIINFGITEDDINWRKKDNYMVGDDKIDDKQCGNIMSGEEYGWGGFSGRGYSDGDGYGWGFLSGREYSDGSGFGKGRT